MVQGNDTRYYQVRLTVPRKVGWWQWRTVRGEFGRKLAGQESPAVIGPDIDSELRRGRDYVRAVIVMTVASADVAEALAAAWWAFREAAGHDLAGWDTAAASAEVKPG
jgi:hypothetical protein